MKSHYLERYILFECYIAKEHVVYEKNCTSLTKRRILLSIYFDNHIIGTFEKVSFSGIEYVCAHSFVVLYLKRGISNQEKFIVSKIKDLR